MMIFQLENLVERTVAEKRSLSDYVNNYQGMHSKPFAEELYSKVVDCLAGKYLIGACTSASLTGICFVFAEIAYQKQNAFIGLPSVLGMGVFFSYFLISAVRLIELENNSEKIKEQSRELSQKVIKRKLGIEK